MPIHDWTRVGAGIFHAFHHQWVGQLAHALNQGLLPDDYYALPEQQAAGFGPDVLTLQEAVEDDNRSGDTQGHSGGTATLIVPNRRPVAETDLAFYRRKQKVVAVRHASGDRVVAMIELVSPGNKAARRPLRAFVEKAAELLEAGIHLLVIDLHPPTRRDPLGIHAEIWQEIAGEEPKPPLEKPLTLAAYEAVEVIRAYVEYAIVGDELCDMPLFLQSERAIMVPLEATYNAAFADVPRRWRSVLEAMP